jgi:hypothetical protein
MFTIHSLQLNSATARLQLNSLDIPVTLINPYSDRGNCTSLYGCVIAMFTEALLGNAAKRCLLQCRVATSLLQLGSAWHGTEKHSFPYCCITWQLTFYQESVFVVTRSTSRCPTTVWHVTVETNLKWKHLCLKLSEIHPYMDRLWSLKCLAVLLKAVICGYCSYMESA